MTKFKVCSKIHLFIIISVLVIAIGMAVGTICHFCAGGFFNYGNEFKSYKSVTVTYHTSEYVDENAIKPVCDKALADFSAYEVSCADARLGGEIIYKYAYSTDTAALQAAVDKLNAEIDVKGSGLNVASLHEGKIEAGGGKAITFASIALASAAAFQFIYFVLRYKLRAACSALLACVHNLGVFVALLAITRIPVGGEAIAVAAAVVFLTMILSGGIFDRTRKNFASEIYAKTDRTEVVDISACEVRSVSFYGVCAVAAACLIFGVAACIAQLWIGAFAPFVAAILGCIACLYGGIFFTPAVHGKIDLLCERVKSSKKKTGKPAKSAKKEKPTTETV